MARLALLYALSGFCALSLELLWFRVIEVAVKSTAYTFGTVLSVYLGGIGAGSVAGAWYAPRLRRPLRAFLLSQCLILGLSGLALALLVALPADTPGLHWYFELWGTRRSFNLGGAWSWPAVLRLYLALPLALFGAPAALMGFSFMALQGTVQDDVRTSGRKVGLLQAANLVGCVAGCLVFGLGVLHRLGSLGALRLLLLCGLVFAVLGLRSAGGRRPFVVAGGRWRRSSSAAGVARALAAPARPERRARRWSARTRPAWPRSRRWTRRTVERGGSGSAAGTTAGCPSGASTRRWERSPP